jgi:chorismate dehydratase
MKIGRIPYLSCEPFYFAMERRGLDLYDVLPSALAQALTTGALDAGLLPLSDCLHLPDECRLLSGFCLAIVRKAGSVLLHSQRPLQDLSGAAIGIPDEAATSLRLLQIILALKHQVPSVTYVPLSEPHEAFLVQGNTGLRQRHGAAGYPHTYDLGEEWYQWTQLPFVFARWVVRQDLPRRDVLILEDMLYTGLQDWADGIFRSSTVRDDLHMHPRDLHEYTQGIRYFLGVTEQRAMERFQQCLEQLPRP